MDTWKIERRSSMTLINTHKGGYVPAYLDDTIATTHRRR